jgi:hypothetical protein
VTPSSLFARFLTEGIEITLKHVALLDGRPVRTRWRRIVGPVVVKEVTVVVTIVVKRSKIRALKPHFCWWS